MEGTNQAVAAAPQPSSAMPTASAPSVAYQPVMSQSPTYLASPTIPQTIPVAPPVTYQPVQGQPVSAANLGQGQAQEANPWQEAFQALSASLNTNNRSQAQAQYSAYQTPTNQASTQLNWGSTANSVTPQQWLNRTSTSYATPTQAASQTQVAQQVAAQQAEVSDGFLSGVSDQSLEVLEHFGAEAPALLNQYACAVEDALIEQVGVTQHQSMLLEAAGKERQAMNIMLTNPDVLADYVNDFFGPNGPYPTPTKEEQKENRIAAKRYGMEQDIKQMETRGNVPTAFQRPQMEMPRRNKQANQVQNFWNGFGQMMDQNPENAWKYLSQADSRAFQSKMLVQDL